MTETIPAESTAIEFLEVTYIITPLHSCNKYAIDEISMQDYNRLYGRVKNGQYRKKTEKGKNS